MRCVKCQTKMQARTAADHVYAESGLPNVVLKGVEIARCPACGEEAVGIPRIEQLHRLLAHLVIRQRARLAPGEVRFLRKYLGLSGADFARHVGVTAETVSRWENGKEPIGPANDRLLRMMIAHGRPVEDYPLETLTAVAQEDAEPPCIGVRAGREGWTEADAA